MRWTSDEKDRGVQQNRTHELNQFSTFPPFLLVSVTLPQPALLLPIFEFCPWFPKLVPSVYSIFFSNSNPSFLVSLPSSLLRTLTLVVPLSHCFLSFFSLSPASSSLSHSLFLKLILFPFFDSLSPSSLSLWSSSGLTCKLLHSFSSPSLAFFTLCSHSRLHSPFALSLSCCFSFSTSNPNLPPSNSKSPSSLLFSKDTPRSHSLTQALSLSPTPLAHGLSLSVPSSSLSGSLSFLFPLTLFPSLLPQAHLPVLPPLGSLTLLWRARDLPPFCFPSS